MKQLLMAGAALAIGIVPAFAATSPVQPEPGQSAGSGAAANNNAVTGAPSGMPSAQQDAHANIRQQMTSNLRQAGFTDVKIMPDSFLVQAKDKSGNPVTMFMNPDSMTMFTEASATGGAARGSAMNRNGQSNTAATASNQGTFANVQPGANEEMASKVIGLDVYNNANQDIGKIKDVAMDDNGVKAYIVAVGGFLGMGDHYVAVNPSAIDVSYDAGNKTWHAKMNTNAAQLKAAPEYKYSSNG